MESSKMLVHSAILRLYYNKIINNSNIYSCYRVLLADSVVRLMPLYEFNWLYIEDFEQTKFDPYTGMHKTSTTYTENYLYLNIIYILLIL